MGEGCIKQFRAQTKVIGARSPIAVQIDLTRSYNWSYTIDACNATNTAYSKLTPVVG